MEKFISSLETQLIEYSMSLVFEDLSPKVISQAKRRITDTIGGALGAFEAKPVEIARTVVPKVNNARSARIWGSLEKSTPEGAAFANGTMLRYLDINDTHRTIDGSHPSDNLGGVIALAESLNLGGRDVLLALTISYEIQCRFVDSVPFNENGWDQPVPGVIAMALAAGRMLNLNASSMRDALALAVTPNLCTYQTRAGELSMWKGAAAANGARQGIFAAMLASKGMTGPFEAFDGIYGLWNQTIKKQHNIAPLSFGKSLFGVEQTNIKMYPVRDSCQLPVQTARNLRKKIAAKDIKSLKIVTYGSAYKGAVEDPELWAPKTRETADHSMLIAVALGLIDGTITPESFESDRFLDRDVLELIAKTEVEISPEFSAMSPAIRTCQLIAKNSESKRFNSKLSLTAKDIELGPSDEEIQSKFYSLTERVMNNERAKLLFEASMNLENMKKISTLVDLTKV
jgi:2-methylcitrate dehydratase